MKIITVIAYKENAVDTCRGCVMSTHDSAFDMLSSANPETIVEFVADLRARDLDEYASFDFTYLVNGRNIHSDSGYYPDVISEELEPEIVEEYEDVIQRIKQEVDARTTVLAKARKEAKEKEALAQTNRAKVSQENAERRQFEALKAKYEGEVS